MFDINTVSKRYFGIKLSYIDEEEETHTAQLEVEPPKIKVLKKITALSKMRKNDSEDSENQDVMAELSEAVRTLLSKNKNEYKVPMEYIDDLDFDQLQGILTAYFEWLAKEKNSPN